MSLTDLAIKRIRKDLKELHTTPLDNCGIYVHSKDEDISTATALIIGPEDTPYAHGFYLFEFKFPNNYPFEPPVARFCTIDPKGQTRFHPNLYIIDNGKVCLSILNTWTGPPWTSVQTFSSILLSIRSILDENPLQNEPGYELANANKYNEYDDILHNYNCCIRYENIRVAIIHIMEHLPGNFSHFKPVIQDYYFKNYEKIQNMCIEFDNKYSGKFYSDTFSMAINTDYKSLSKKLETLYIPLAMDKEKATDKDKGKEKDKSTDKDKEKDTEKDKDTDKGKEKEIPKKKLIKIKKAK
jgi:ubiquitin-protein ligase